MIRSKSGPSTLDASASNTKLLGCRAPRIGVARSSPKMPSLRVSCFKKTQSGYIVGLAMWYSDLAQALHETQTNHDASGSLIHCLSDRISCRSMRRSAAAPRGLVVPPATFAPRTSIPISPNLWTATMRLRKRKVAVVAQPLVVPHSPILIRQKSLSLVLRPVARLRRVRRFPALRSSSRRVARRFLTRNSGPRCVATNLPLAKVLRSQ